MPLFPPVATDRAVALEITLAPIKDDTAIGIIPETRLVTMIVVGGGTARMAGIADEEAIIATAEEEIAAGTEAETESMKDPRVTTTAVFEMEQTDRRRGRKVGSMGGMIIMGETVVTIVVNFAMEWAALETIVSIGIMMVVVCQQ